MKATQEAAWDFSEDEWAAIDLAVIRVYQKHQAILPATWQASGITRRRVRSGRWHRDPAGALRSWAYEYAATHPDDIHSREDWQITHHVSGRLGQHVRRQLKTKHQEIPYGIGHDFDKATADRAAITEKRMPLDDDRYLDGLDRYGRYIPSDQLQFVCTGYSFARDSFIYETPERMDALHTRPPTITEWWNEHNTEEDRNTYRANIAAAFKDGICECTKHSTQRRVAA